MEHSFEIVRNPVQLRVTGDGEHENFQVTYSEKQNFKHAGVSHEGSGINVEDVGVSLCDVDESLPVHVGVQFDMAKGKASSSPPTHYDDALAIRNSPQHSCGEERLDGDSGGEDDESDETGQSPCENGGETNTKEGGIIIARNPQQGGGADIYCSYGRENPTTPPSPPVQRAELSRSAVEQDDQSSNPGHHLITSFATQLNTGGQKDEESHDPSLPPAQTRHPPPQDEMHPEEPSSTVRIFTGTHTSIDKP